MNNETDNKPMTREAALADPTNEPRGFTRMKPKTRHLRRFDHANQSAKSAVALSPCEVIAPDGTRHRFVKRNNRIKHEVYVSGVEVQLHRKRAPRTDLGSTLARAESLGLNLLAVRDEYRHRVDNGYSRATAVEILTNATFRGGDA